VILGPAALAICFCILRGINLEVKNASPTQDLFNALAMPYNVPALMIDIGVAIRNGDLPTTFINEQDLANLEQTAWDKISPPPAISPILSDEEKQQPLQLDWELNPDFFKDIDYAVNTSLKDLWSKLRTLPEHSAREIVKYMFAHSPIVFPNKELRGVVIGGIAWAFLSFGGGFLEKKDSEFEND